MSPKKKEPKEKAPSRKAYAGKFRCLFCGGDVDRGREHVPNCSGIIKKT